MSIVGTRVAAGFLVTVAAIFGLGLLSANADKDSVFFSCLTFNQKYHHGVGLDRATDAAARGKEPVTTFRRDTALYERALIANVELDRDYDGIVCEHR